jgi:hypothetical protein
MRRQTSGGDPVTDDAKATAKAGIITQKSPSERLIGQPDGPTWSAPVVQTVDDAERRLGAETRNSGL